MLYRLETWCCRKAVQGMKKTHIVAEKALQGMKYLHNAAEKTLQGMNKKTTMLQKRHCKEWNMHGVVEKTVQGMNKKTTMLQKRQCKEWIKKPTMLQKRHCKEWNMHGVVEKTVREMKYAWRCRKEEAGKKPPCHTCPFKSKSAKPEWRFRDHTMVANTRPKRPKVTNWRPPTRHLCE